MAKLLRIFMKNTVYYTQDCIVPDDITEDEIENLKDERISNFDNEQIESSRFDGSNAELCGNRDYQTGDIVFMRNEFGELEEIEPETKQD